MSKFSRRLDQNIINKLKAEPLFSDCLLPDIEKGHVFPAVRNNRVHFYCGGRRLFEYTASGFRTHVKFASVLIGKRNGYIDESQLNGVKPISRFTDGYEAIKEVCEKYAGEEAKGISSIISRPEIHTRSTIDRWIIPLDVEACFNKSNDDEETQWIESISSSSMRTPKNFGSVRQSAMGTGSSGRNGVQGRA